MFSSNGFLSTIEWQLTTQTLRGISSLCLGLCWITTGSLLRLRLGWVRSSGASDWVSETKHGSNWVMLSTSLVDWSRFWRWGPVPVHYLTCSLPTLSLPTHVHYLAFSLPVFFSTLIFSSQHWESTKRKDFLLFLSFGAYLQQNILKMN